MGKLGGKRSSTPPNISITFEGKPHSNSKAIMRAFKQAVFSCSVLQDRLPGGSWGKSTAIVSWTPHSGSSMSQRPWGKRAVPPPRGLMGLPCSTFAIWGNRAWQSSSTSQLQELIFRPFGRIPSSSRFWRQGSRQQRSWSCSSSLPS